MPAPEREREKDGTMKNGKRGVRIACLVIVGLMVLTLFSGLIAQIAYGI